MTIRIDHEKYGAKTDFGSIEDAEAAIHACGEGFEDVTLRLHGDGDVTDQDGDIVGRELDQTERLTELAERASGLQYDSPEAKLIMDEADWANHWPVVDEDGELTGAVVETEEACNGYANVDDLAMIAEDDVKPGNRWTHVNDDGYAT